MMTLDDAAERLSPELENRVEELAQWLTRSPVTRARSALRTIAREATEAAAKKCEKRSDDRMHELGIYDDTTGAWEASEEVQTRCEEDDDCAAAIRGG